MGFGFQDFLSFVGYGYCRGFCETDADCSGLGAGYSCQADIGLCTKSPVARTKALGAACAVGDDCNCVTGSGTDGFCAQYCVIGGKLCPSGSTCDTGVPMTASITFGLGTLESGVEPQIAGTGGICYARCSSPFDAAAPIALDAGTAEGSSDTSGNAPTDATTTEAQQPIDAGAPEIGDGPREESEALAPVCPPNTVCSAATAAGPDCLP
jgi:hypothetical protein